MRAVPALTSRSRLTVPPPFPPRPPNSMASSPPVPFPVPVPVPSPVPFPPKQSPRGSCRSRCRWSRWPRRCRSRWSRKGRPRCSRSRRPGSPPAAAGWAGCARGAPGRPPCGTRAAGSMNASSRYGAPSTTGPRPPSNTAVMSSPLSVLWLSSACATASSPRWFSRRSASARTSSADRLSSIRSASFWMPGIDPRSAPAPTDAAARAPPGVPPSRRRDAWDQETVRPMPQYPSI